jgi:amino acid transporter
VTDRSHDASDDEQLRRLGYVPQLLREMGGFQNFALSFSIISILTGGITLYGHGLRFGGPLTMTLGWPIVLLATLPIAASMAQLASSFPTAGALYHWSAMLGGRGWGFFTAWLNLVGQVAVTAAVDLGLAEFILGAFGKPATRPLSLYVFAGVLVSHALLNHFGVRLVARLNALSAAYHIAVTAALVLALAMFAPMQPASFLVTRFTNQPFPYTYAFCIGLLQAQWTFTGYDASAHVTEETHDATRNAPWGIFLSVLVSGIAGYIMLLAITLAIGDLRATAAADQPFILVLQSRLGRVLGNAMVWLVLGAMWFCGLASVTSNSRMLFAFARDGGVPFSAQLANVSPKWKTPSTAVWISVLFAFAVSISSKAYAGVAALSTVALYASYGLPIAIGLYARTTGRWNRFGPWDLGRWSTAVNIAALVWTATIMVLFVLPPNQLAGYWFYGLSGALAVWWYGGMRRSFKGPRVTLAGHSAGEARHVDPALQ